MFKLNAKEFPILGGGGEGRARGPVLRMKKESKEAVGAVVKQGYKAKLAKKRKAEELEAKKALKKREDKKKKVAKKEEEKKKKEAKKEKRRVLKEKANMARVLRVQRRKAAKEEKDDVEMAELDEVDEVEEVEVDPVEVDAMVELDEVQEIEVRPVEVDAMAELDEVDAMAELDEVEEVEEVEEEPVEVGAMAELDEVDEVEGEPVEAVFTWNLLPNEIKSAIVKYLDIKTSAILRGYGIKELGIVQRFCKHLVNIRVNYTKTDKFGKDKIVIELDDAASKETHLKWFISSQASGSTKVIFSSFKPQTLVLKNHSVGSATSMILRRILSDQMFSVKKLSFGLANFDENIDLSSISSQIECIELSNCENPESIASILENKNLEFEGVIGESFEDRMFFYEFDYLSYGGPQSLIAGFDLPKTSYNIYEFILGYCNISYYKILQQRPCTEFWDSTLGSYQFEDENDVRNKLKLEKTKNDIACFRYAYYYSCRNWTYDTRYKNKVSFLRDGIDITLGDYQLLILNIVYLVRLFRNEPEIQRIHLKANQDLYVAVKKFEHLNCYEKLLLKIERLLP